MQVLPLLLLISLVLLTSHVLKNANIYFIEKKNLSSTILKVTSMMVFILLTAPTAVKAQESFNWDGEWHRQEHVGWEIREYLIPDDFEEAMLFLRLRGADGGHRTVKEIDGAVRHRVDAGAGATVQGAFKIGYGENEIPPGSKFRMIIGEAGTSTTTQSESAGGGGGGTAILFLPPGAADSEFVLLAVAGGGGGAYSDCCLIKYRGRSAEADNDGSGGRCSNNENSLAGGTNGNGGEGVDDTTIGAGAGGGAYTPGQGACSTCVGGAGGGTDDPYGGRGGFLQAQSANLPGEAGGYGYGAGGQSSGGRFGGGGGGYSGGGVCDLDPNRIEYGGGGGGGSYINEDYATEIIMVKNGETHANIDGYIDYAFEWCYNISSFGIDNPEECDAPYSGAIITFLDPCEIRNSIRLLSGEDVLETNQTGLFNNLVAGDYLVQEVQGNNVITEYSLTISSNGDTEAPAINCVGTGPSLPDTIVIGISETITLTADDFIESLTDNCNVGAINLILNDLVDPDNAPPSSVENVILTSVNAGPVSGTISAEDIHGNQATCSFNIFIEDVPSFPNGCDRVVHISPNGMSVLSEVNITPAFDRITPENELEYSWDFSILYSCDDVLEPQIHVVTVEDQYGNQNTCTATLTIVDTIRPTIHCRDLVLDIDENGPPSIEYTDFIVSASDNCLVEEEIIGGYYWDTNILPLDLDCSHVGTYEIELLSNPVSHELDLPPCVAQLTVRDVVAPTIECRDTTIHIDQGNARFTRETLPIALITDNCYSRSELDFSWKKTTSFTCADLGSDENSWIDVTDPSGNTSRCVFTLTVLDTTVANVRCRSRNFTLTQANDFSYTLRTQDVFTGLTSVCNSELDHPGTLAFSEGTDLILDCDDTGSPTEVTLEFIPDDGSPPSSCTSTITVREANRPNLTCPDGFIDVPATYEDCGATVEYDYVAWDDECPGVDVSLEEGLPSGSFFPIGWTSQVIRVWDSSGNTTACSFTVRVANPTGAPGIECPDSYSVNIEDESCTILIDTSAVFQTTCNVFNSQLSGQPMGTMFGQGTHSFAFKSRNTTTNESSQCSFNVTVTRPNSNPTAICRDTTVILSGNSVFLNPEDFDNGSYAVCTDIRNRLLNKYRYYCSDLGENQVVLSVVDHNNLSSTCTATLTLLPENPECQNITVTLNEADIASISVEDIHLPDEVCIHNDSLAIDRTLFDCTDLGINQVTLSRFVDFGEEYTRHCTAMVTVVAAADENDVTPPVALCNPDTTIYIGNDWNFLVDVAAVDAGSYDVGSCTEELTFVLSDEVYFCDELEPYEYFLTVSDGNGNESNCSTIITLADTLGPEIIHCVDIIIDLDAGGNYALTFDDLDNAFLTREVCLSGGYDLSQVQLTFDCTDAGATIPMTITAGDIHGNRSNECDFSISVEDPFETCPPGPLLVAVKMFLAGTYDELSGLMNDDLRTLGLIPNESPYGSGETVSDPVFSVSGSDAIVDWVLVELRSPSDNTEVLHTRAALLQRDGDVVDVDGLSPVTFTGAEAGNYFVAVQHRNHLGVMTANPITIGDLSRVNVNMSNTPSGN